MPRKRRSGKTIVDLADLVWRNYRQRRHHPYNLRPSTLRRVPGSMNERTLWRNQVNPPPVCHDDELIGASGSRLHLAAVDIKPFNIECAKLEKRKEALSSTSSSRRLNQMAAAVMAMPPPETSKLQLIKNQFTMDKTDSTVILHRNLHFDAEGAKYSGILKQKRPAPKDVPKKNAKKKRASAPGSRGSNKSSRSASASGSADSENATTDNSKTESEESNSFDGNVDHIDNRQSFVANIKSEIGIEMAGCGERKDQELAPPPPPPLLPHVQHAQCPTLASILESVDNFLRTVTKTQ